MKDVINWTTWAYNRAYSVGPGFSVFLLQAHDCIHNVDTCVCFVRLHLDISAFDWDIPTAKLLDGSEISFTTCNSDQMNRAVVFLRLVQLETGDKL